MVPVCCWRITHCNTHKSLTLIPIVDVPQHERKWFNENFPFYLLHNRLSYIMKCPLDANPLFNRQTFHNRGLVSPAKVILWGVFYADRDLSVCELLEVREDQHVLNHIIWASGPPHRSCSSSSGNVLVNISVSPDLLLSFVSDALIQMHYKMITQIHIQAVYWLVLSV